MSTCKSCGANIIWVKTAKGKNHPLDAKPDPNGEWIISRNYGDDATMIRAKNTNPESDPRFTSHFATCPNADQHRRAR